MMLDMNIYNVTFEIYIGDKLVQRESCRAPVVILKQQFMSLVEQIANDERPMRIRMVKKETIWDQFEQKQKILNNYVEFNNKGDVNDN